MCLNVKFVPRAPFASQGPSLQSTAPWVVLPSQAPRFVLHVSATRTRTRIAKEAARNARSATTAHGARVCRCLPPAFQAHLSWAISRTKTIVNPACLAMSALAVTLNPVFAARAPSLKGHAPHCAETARRPQTGLAAISRRMALHRALIVWLDITAPQEPPHRFPVSQDFIQIRPA